MLVCWRREHVRGQECFASVVTLEVAIGIQRRHAAGARRGDGLAVDMVRDIAGGEDARHAGRRGVTVEPLFTLM